MKLSHVDDSGKARMVDISGKPPMHREAVAAGKIILAPATLELLKNNRLQKGDVLAVARVAAIQGGKKTAELIPLCHPLAIHQLDVQFHVVADGVEITAQRRQRRQDRDRDGSVDRGERRRPDHLRHVQGGRQENDHRRHRPAGEEQA